MYLLTQAFHEHASPGADDLPSLTVGALNWFARKVAPSVTDYAAGRQQGPSRAFFVTNTDDCRSPAAYTAHWISVAIFSMRWDPPPPL